jgi:hypothetical protein
MLEQSVFTVISGDLTECKECSINKRLSPTIFICQNMEYALFGWNVALTGMIIRSGSKQSTRAGIQ